MWQTLASLYPAPIFTASFAVEERTFEHKDPTKIIYGYQSFLLLWIFF
jgi:hypothetical protein